ncbi:Hpt domain-containing protein [Lachnospiraceae bacterium ZAX-1]
MNEAIKKELEENGADVVGSIVRMARNENLYERILLKFLSDATYEKLKEDVAAKNYEEVFKGAHTLKGVSGNLGLNKLTDAVTIVLEKARNQTTDGIEQDMEAVTAAYDIYFNCISKLKKE